MPITETIRHKIADFAFLIPRLGEITDDEFDREFHTRLHLIETESQQLSDKRDILMKEFSNQTATELEHGIMHRHSRAKPLGYAGDHTMIDMIYDKRAASYGKGRLQDEFFHRQTAPQAVRNRKSFFIDTFTELCRSTATPAVLDIACGPCRDVAEGIVAAGENATGCHFHCVDMDPNTITYAQKVVAEALGSAPLTQRFTSRSLSGVKGNIPTFTWQTANAFRIRQERTYDLTWSAGLFDYLDERRAALLLKKMWSWAAVGGELIVGNFHASNPDRPWMEWCGDWRLIHRTEEEMLRLCDKAGIPRNAVRFHFEPTGVNMFLRVRKG